VTIVEARLIGEKDVNCYQERTLNSLRKTNLTNSKKKLCPWIQILCKCTYHKYKAIISIIYQA
jgi:hypothetical protein